MSNSIHDARTHVYKIHLQQLARLSIAGSIKVTFLHAFEVCCWIKPGNEVTLFYTNLNMMPHGNKGTQLKVFFKKMLRRILGHKQLEDGEYFVKMENFLWSWRIFRDDWDYFVKMENISCRWRIFREENVKNLHFIIKRKWIGFAGVLGRWNIQRYTVFI